MRIDMQLLEGKTIDINDSTYIMRVDEIEYFQREFKNECERLGLKKLV